MLYLHTRFTHLAVTNCLKAKNCQYKTLQSFVSFSSNGRVPRLVFALRRLPTVQPIFGHLGNTPALINMSYFFKLDMKI